MRKVALWAVFLSVAAGAVSAAPKPKIMVHGDVAVPTTPDALTEGFSVGLGGGVGVAFAISSRVVLIADVDYVIFGLDDEGFRQAYGLSPSDSLSGGNQIASVYASFSIKLLAPTAGPLKPYAFGGAGFFRSNPDELTVNGVSMGLRAEDTVGVHIGGGVALDLAPYLGVFVDAFYVYGFTEEPMSYLPIRAGIAFEWKAEE